MKKSGNRVLVISSGAIPDNKQDNRSWGLAESLGLDEDVILAGPSLTGASHSSFAVVYYNHRNIDMIARDSDVVICDPDVVKAHPSLINAGTPVAVDLAAVPAAGGPFRKPALKPFWRWLISFFVPMSGPVAFGSRR